MKVLMLNTFDELGGAGRAASRLQAGMQELGVDSRLLVQFRVGNARNVLCSPSPLQRLLRRFKAWLGTLPVRLYPNRPENNFSPALVPGRAPAEIDHIDPDILHLHWLGAGFLSIEALAKLRRPILWTLHDSWAFTGGCHVPFDCDRYRQRCGACPVLGSSRPRDLSRWTWHRKERTWRGLELTVVAPSRWLAECARSSSLLRDVRIEVIPNGLDTEVFAPRDRERSRGLLGLPRDRKIILFGGIRGTSDPNKGLHLLAPALRSLGRDMTGLVAVVFSSFDRGELPDLGMPAVSLGAIENDDQLAAAYSAAEVFVAPSIQETFCQTAAEALACGTPVVAFGATGLLDVVEHRRCGYLARPYHSDDLARGIAWVLEDEERRAALSRRARSKAGTEFALPAVARRYRELYRELTDAR